MPKKAVVLLLAASFAILGACSGESSDQKGGPGEKAGRAVDRAMDKAGQAVEKAGRNMQGASKGEK